MTTADATRSEGDGTYDADLRFTTHGVVHVRAADWGSLGFGQGWACARDHLPTIADQVVKVRSERARFHGPGATGGNVASDLGYRMLRVTDLAVTFRDAQPDVVRRLVEGYVAGYNRRVDEVLADRSQLPTWCADAPWIRRISELDLYAYLVDVAMMASGRNLVQLIGRAEAPGADGPHPPSPMEALAGNTGASNGWALGGDVSASGGGMVLANPHFPWYGEARFWECHLTVPGEYDVYGVALLGTPGVQMGFNSGLGWAHTFSCGHRFTLYRLDLVPGSPTSYRYGDERREMVPEVHRVDVVGDGGAVEEVERTLWRTHHGPMLNLPLLGWSEEIGFTYRDANVDNVEIFEQFLRMGMATDVDGFRDVFHTVKGMPWVNTLAADATGRAWYCDGSATPRLTAGATARYEARLTEDLVAALLAENRIALLDGSDPDDEWQSHPDARSPGLEPPAELPEIEVRDVVVNANDSHWLVHPTRTIDGRPVLCGPERSPRSLRTRQNLRRAAALAARGGVTVEDLLEAVFDNASLSAELLLDDVVARCRAAGTVVVEGHEADLSVVADVLEGWDRALGLDSVGGVLWRELMAGFEPLAWRDAGPLFEVGFDPDDPVTTPHTLAPGGDLDPVALAAGHAVRVLAAAGLAPDVAVRDAQWAARGDRRVPVPGGNEGEGLLNVSVPTGALPSASVEPVPDPVVQIDGRERTGLCEGGYRVTYGTSFLMGVELTPEGPRGVGLLAYGQNEDPRSPHHADGTEAFAEGRVRPLRFTDAEVEADPELTRVHLTS